MINVIPVPGFFAPTVYIPASRFFINHFSMVKNLAVFFPMPLIRGYKPNRTVAVKIIIPKDKLAYPVARLLDRFKPVFGIVRTIFERTKERL